VVGGGGVRIKIQNSSTGKKRKEDPRVGIKCGKCSKYQEYSDGLPHRGMWRMLRSLVEKKANWSALGKREKGEGGERW